MNLLLLAPTLLALPACSTPDVPTARAPDVPQAVATLRTPEGRDLGRVIVTEPEDASDSPTEIEVALLLIPDTMPRHLTLHEGTTCDDIGPRFRATTASVDAAASDDHPANLGSVTATSDGRVEAQFMRSDIHLGGSNGVAGHTVVLVDDRVDDPVACGVLASVEGQRVPDLFP